jgi:hypothetical protein
LLVVAPVVREERRESLAQRSQHRRRRRHCEVGLRKAGMAEEWARETGGGKAMSDSLRSRFLSHLLRCPHNTT